MDDDLQAPWDDEAPRQHTEVRIATVTKIKGKSKKSVNDWRAIETDNEIPKWTGMFGDDVAVGVEIEAAGYVERSSEYGTSFNVTDVIAIVGNHAAEIQWLASEFKDIGPKRAKAIAKKYPTTEELQDMLFNRPEELEDISGITRARAQEISEHYQKHKQVLDTTFELVRFGLKPYSLAKRVVQTLGTNALLERVRQDPYILYDVSGITFLKADEVAEALGVRRTDPRRFRCWLRDQLEKARGSERESKGKDKKDKSERAKAVEKIKIPYLTGGDCLALAREMFDAQLPEFKYSLRQISDAIDSSDHLTTTRRVEAVRDMPHLGVSKGEIIMGGVMLAELDDAERTVADKARELSARPNVQLPFQPNMAAGGKSLDESQQKAVLGLTSNGFAVMTGGPGVGKTTTLKTALVAFTQAGYKVELAAPTGKAAKRMTQSTGMPARTIHKLLEWTPEGFLRNHENFIDADVVVLDESSMIDIELAASLFAAIGPKTRLLFVGDADQLPPVGPGQPFFDLITSGGVPRFVLTKTHRQAEGSWVIDNARRIISGAMPDLRTARDENGDVTFQFVEANSQQIVDHVVRTYSQAKRDGSEGELVILAAVKDGPAGVWALNRAVQQAVNPYAASERNPHVYGGKSGSEGERYGLYIGDKIIYTKNRADLGLVNGDTGEIVDMQLGTYAADHVVYVRFDGFDDSPEHPDGVFELKGEHYTTMDLAYALTVHKSQGSEWKRVVVVADYSHFFMKRQLLYTAITRTSKYLTIIGSAERVQGAVQSPLDTNRATRLVERLLGLM